ncbi:MAG: hypothetical protein C0621_09735 [Desulfuromonas sp.]|nr:MAG: hypothetical protein C0621_09735 [Desulfuromonas sp.]
MSLDAPLIASLVDELRPSLTGAAINKIYQVGADDLLLRLWNGRENLRLLLSVAPAVARLHLTTVSWPTPTAPPRFGQLLRSRLRRLLAIDVAPQERILYFTFVGSDNKSWKLVAELFTTAGNLLLLDDQGGIVDLLHRRVETGRDLEPGALYHSPPLPRGERLSSVELADQQAALSCGLTIEAWQAARAAREGRPGWGDWQGKAILFATPPLFLPLKKSQSFATLSQAVESFYAERSTSRLFAPGRDELAKRLAKEQTRLEKRLKKLASDERAALGHERYRQQGDLLVANLHRLRRGMPTVTLDDWYGESGATCNIALDPALTPQENVERYYKRQRKGKRALVHIKRRRDETQQELQWLDGIAQALKECRDSDDLTALIDEMRDEGLLKEKTTSARRRPSRAPEQGVRRARTPGGYAIFWGSNNRSNDHVSRQLTRRDDLWFHALNSPGCHVCLRRHGEEEVSESDQRYAAAIAAGYSRAQNEGHVDVMVTEGRHVHKPKGAKPGLVQVEQYRTLRVTPRRLESKELESSLK